MGASGRRPAGRSAAGRARPLRQRQPPPRPEHALTSGWDDREERRLCHMLLPYTWYFPISATRPLPRPHLSTAAAKYCPASERYSVSCRGATRCCRGTRSPLRHHSMFGSFLQTISDTQTMWSQCELNSRRKKTVRQLADALHVVIPVFVIGVTQT